MPRLHDIEKPGSHGIIRDTATTAFYILSATMRVTTHSKGFHASLSLRNTIYL